MFLLDSPVKPKSPFVCTQRTTATESLHTLATKSHPIFSVLSQSQSSSAKSKTITMSSLQPQQQQPALVYPNNVRGQPSSSHHSNGSFGTVFIVLAVIVVISAIACFLGRLCNRRLHSSKPNNQPAHNFRPGKKGAAGDHHHMEFGNNKPSFQAPKDADIEFGFDKKIPNGNGSRSESRGYTNNHSKPHHANGDHHINVKGEMKHPGDHVVIGEPRATG